LFPIGNTRSTANVSVEGQKPLKVIIVDITYRRNMLYIFIPLYLLIPLSMVGPYRWKRGTSNIRCGLMLWLRARTQAERNNELGPQPGGLVPPRLPPRTAIWKPPCLLNPARVTTKAAVCCAVSRLMNSPVNGQALSPRMRAPQKRPRNVGVLQTNSFAR